MEPKNIYIGNRYVPKIIGIHNLLMNYESLSIVLWEGNSYTSKQEVPAGVLLTNEEYWVQTGNFNGQVEQLKNEVKGYKQVVTEYVTEIKKAKQYVKLRALGAKGNGIDNDTVAYEAFLKSGGDLLIEDGSYMVEAKQYQIASNTNLYFSKNAKIKLLPHNSDTYSILQMKDVDNVEIFNPVIDGSKSTNTMTVGEWGHGIDILNSTNIKIHNPVVTNTFGDGIYLGHNYWGSTTKITDTVLITNPLVDGARRNGISVCGGRNLTITNPVIKNIRGTNPMAAIDIEPEGMTGVAPMLENLVITNLTAINCATALELLLDNLKDRNLTTDIQVNGIKAIQCDGALTIRKLNGQLSGTVNISNLQSIKSKNGVIFMSGYNAENTPHITINGVEVDEFNTSLSANDYYNHFLTIIALPEDITNSDVGNISVINPTIKESKNDRFRFIFATLFNTTKKIKNVSIINPSIVTSKEKTSFIRDNPDIKIVDSLETLSLIMKTDYFEHFLHVNLISYMDNKQATELVTLFSDDSKILLNKKVKLRVMTDQPLKFKPTTFIGGYTTGGKGLYSNNIGDVLELSFVGDRWMVDNMIGTWLVEE